jgi:undecaprenyl-diphosphatase
MAVAVVVFIVLALIVTHLFPTSPVRASAWALAVIAIAAVGFSRIELGVHWSTDVMASLVFVSLWLLAIVTLFRKELSDAGRRGPT